MRQISVTTSRVEGQTALTVRHVVRKYTSIVVKIAIYSFLCSLVELHTALDFCYPIVLGQKGT